MSHKNSLKGLHAAYMTLGCKLNFAETATLQDELTRRGLLTAEGDERADVCIVNTCSVTDVADQKCRQAIRRLSRSNAGAPVVVMGCYAQLQPELLRSMPEVRLVIGIREKARAANMIERLLLCGDAEATADAEAPFVPSCSCGERTRYFLKVQDGCNYFCTYCTIPYARGRSRNGSIESLVEQARDAARAGGKEIVLTGVNIGDFGKTTGERFIDLVKALDEVEGISRYRISSLEPDLLSDELIAYCAESRAFMPHFHIPLQSGSDTVLKLMHRHYDAQLFADKICKIKALMPDAFIGVDVMVGCRGETPECFEETYEFLDRLDVTQLHVFPYSERPGTSALSIPYTVSDQDKKLRSKRLLDLSDRKTEAFYTQHIGQEAEVLFEKAPRGKAMHGFTKNYIRVELPAKVAKPELDNQLVMVRLGELTADKQALRVECL